MTEFIRGLGRHPQTVALALVLVIAVVVAMEFVSPFLPMFGNPLLLIAGSVLALLGLFRARAAR